MLTGCNLPAGFLPFGMFFELSSIDAAQSTANHQRNSGMIGTGTKEEKFLELIIEIKAKPGKCQELYQTLQGERMPGLPDLPGRGGWRGFLSFGSLGSADKPRTLYTVHKRHGAPRGYQAVE
jgi:hypothetical protein